MPRGMFGADQMPDIFWCGTNAGHSFVHLWVPRLGTCGGGLRRHVSKIFRHVSNIFLCYTKIIWINQNLPCGMFGAEQISDMFGAEQISDIYWCGTNTGHLLVRSKYRTFIGAEQIPDIYWCGTNNFHYFVM